VSEDQFATCLKNGRAVLRELKGRKELLSFCLSLPIFNALRKYSKAPSKFLSVGTPEGVADNSELLDRYVRVCIQTLQAVYVHMYKYTMCRSTHKSGCNSG